jgi:hypothetical protein
MWSSSISSFMPVYPGAPKINGHLQGGQPLVALDAYQDNRAVAALLVSVRDRIREVQP